jgi:hypothetical protein
MLPAESEGARHTGISVTADQIMGSCRKIGCRDNRQRSICDGDAPAAIRRRLRGLSGRGRGLDEGRERERNGPLTWMHSKTSFSLAFSAPENDGREQSWFEKVVLNLSDPPFGIKYLALIDDAIVVACGPPSTIPRRFGCPSDTNKFVLFSLICYMSRGGPASPGHVMSRLNLSVLVTDSEFYFIIFWQVEGVRTPKNTFFVFQVCVETA